MKRFMLKLLSFVISACTMQERHIIDLNLHNAFIKSDIDTTLVFLDNYRSNDLDLTTQAKLDLYFYHAMWIKFYNYSDDSLSNKILNQSYYYKDEMDKGLFLFHKAKSQVNQGLFDMAIESFHKAEQYALTHEYYHLLGCIYLRSADMFNDLMLNNTSLRYGEKSIDNFTLALDSSMVIRARGNQGLVYLEMRDYNNAELIYLKTKIDAEKLNDLRYLRYISNWYLWNYIYNGYYNKVATVFRDLEPHFPEIPQTVVENLAFATILMGHGDSEAARTHLKNASSRKMSDLDRLLSYRLNGDFENNFGDKNTAADYFKQYITLFDSLDLFNNRNQLIELEARFENLRYKYLASIEKRKRNQILFFALCIFLVLSLILYRIRIKSLRIKKDLESRLSIISDLDKSNQTLIEKLNVQKEIDLDIKKRLEAQLQYQKDLVNLYSDYGKRPQLFVKKIDALLKHNTFDENAYTNLFTVIDAYYDNSLQKIRVMNTDLNQNELLICGLLLAGFKAQEICIIMDYKSMDVVYSKKYRIKQKLNIDKNMTLDEFLSSFYSHDKAQNN